MTKPHRTLNLHSIKNRNLFHSHICVRFMEDLRFSCSGQGGNGKKCTFYNYLTVYVWRCQMFFVPLQLKWRSERARIQRNATAQKAKQPSSRAQKEVLTSRRVRTEGHKGGTRRPAKWPPQGQRNATRASVQSILAPRTSYLAPRKTTINHQPSTINH